MEEKNWKPGTWKKGIVRRRISNARREIYRIALAAEKPADSAGLCEAVLELCASEMALEATAENGRIGATVHSISRRLETALVAFPMKRSGDLQTAMA